MSSSLACFIDIRALEEQLLTYLDIAGVQSLHATESSMSIACSRNEIWMAVAVKALPGFVLGSALFDAECRQLFMSAFPVLAKAVVARRSSMLVSSMDDVRSILPLLNRAHKTVADHRQKGHVAQVVIGCLRFNDGIQANAMCSTGSSDEAVDMEMCRSAPIEVHGMHQHILGLEFAWKRGSLAVRLSPVFDDAGTSQVCKQVLTVDIAISSSALTLQQRGVKVEVGEGWSFGTSGISSFRNGTGAAVDALSQGVNCVLCLRAGSVESRASNNVSHALNLDQARSPVMRGQAMPAIRRGASW